MKKVTWPAFRCCKKSWSKYTTYLHFFWWKWWKNIKKVISTSRQQSTHLMVETHNIGWRKSKLLLKCKVLKDKLSFFTLSVSFTPQNWDPKNGKKFRNFFALRIEGVEVNLNLFVTFSLSLSLSLSLSHSPFYLHLVLSHWLTRFLHRTFTLQFLTFFILQHGTK